MLKDKRRRFLQIAQITQNKYFAIYFQYLKEALSDEVDFFVHISMISLLQIYSVILMRIVKHSQSSPKIANLQCLYNISKKDVKDEVSFLHADKHQTVLKVYFNTLGIKVPYKINSIVINGHDQAILFFVTEFLS